MKITPLRTVLLYLGIVAIAGLSIPRLSISMMPDFSSAAITISYSLPDNSPESIEWQVTAVLENALSHLSQLKKISSVSNYNTGTVALQFDRSADLEMKKFEISSLIRQLYPRLPAGTSYPTVKGGGSLHNLENRPLLTYYIQPADNSKHIESLLRKALNETKGIGRLEVSRMEDVRIIVQPDLNKCNTWNISPGMIMEALSDNYQTSYAGHIAMPDGKDYFLIMPAPEISIESLQQISIPTENNRVALSDIATVFPESSQPSSYFRINGRQAATLQIYARAGANRLSAGREAKEIIHQTLPSIPTDHRLMLAYDDNELLEKELDKNCRRAVFSLFILLLFIIMSYRRWAYVVVLTACLCVSLALTLISAYLLAIPVHLYTISGIAVSLGIMVDNSIVILDNDYRSKKKSIYPVLAAVNLTIVSAMGFIFFLTETELYRFSDFSVIIIISLCASLITSILFAPALLKLLRGNDARPVKRKKRILVNWMHFYGQTVNHISSYRKIYIAAIVLGFGLPLFLLPEKWDGVGQTLYNHTIGSDLYQRRLKPFIDKYTGGTLRPFLTTINFRPASEESSETRLVIEARLPQGSTADQLNVTFLDMEKYLAAIKGIEVYTTNIFSGEYGNIEIAFKKEYESSPLPDQLKNILMTYAMNRGGVEWKIYGMGDGFNNSREKNRADFKLVLKGYDYATLCRQTETLASRLASHARMQHINTNAASDDDVEKQKQVYVLHTDYYNLLLNKTAKDEVMYQLFFLSGASNSGLRIKDDPVVMKSRQSYNFSTHDLLFYPLHVRQGRYVQAHSFSNLNMQSLATSIYRENRQYVKMISMQYIGPYEDGYRIITKLLDNTQKNMPLGYTITEETPPTPLDDNRKYIFPLALIVIIFILCSILFENLQQPLLVVCIIPVSFIGLFIAFAVTGINFDHGGYAAFVLLGSLSANSAIFIINDLRAAAQGKQMLHSVAYNAAVIKAAFKRSRTILLTTVSICCGFIPVLLETRQEEFWTALATGTVGGLLFALLTCLVLLPALLYKKIR